MRNYCLEFVRIICHSGAKVRQNQDFAEAKKITYPALLLWEEGLQ